jgi:hypothetical protein
MSGVLVAVDIDRTLIYSAAAQLLGAPDESSSAAVGRVEAGSGELVEVERFEGRPAAAMTARAAALLLELRAAAHLVPVTTRTTAQFERVRWPGGPLPYAITTNGARILVGGAEDEDWSAVVAARIADGCGPIGAVREILAHAGPWLLRLRDADQLFSYAIVDRPLLPAQELAELRARLSALNWVVSVQGSKLYCLPVPLTKSAAAAELADRLGSSASLAAGDSLLDADVLAWADRAIRPAHGELAAAGWRIPGLEVTSAQGILAGEQILDWLLSQTRALAGSAR